MIEQINISKNYCEWLENRKVVNIAKMKKQVEVYQMFIDLLTSFKEELASWDNKVINKRISNTLQSLHKDVVITMTIEGFSNPRNVIMVYAGQKNCTFSVYNEKTNSNEYGYIADDNWSFTLVSVKPNPLVFPRNTQPRLDYNATIEDINKQIDYIGLYIDRLNDCITNFDEYINYGLKIKETIEKYERDVPQELRLDISVHDWRNL